jgi:hypothetical protein
MKTKFWTFMIMFSLAVLVLTGCQNKPMDAARKAAGIADFSLPDGYQPEMALEIAGYTVVSYNPGDGHSHLYLVQAPTSEDVTPEKLEEMLSQAQTGQRDKTTRMTIVETRTETIRGQAATLVISEGMNGDGDTYRQMTTAFKGKGGPALLVLEEPLTHWDDARVTQLIASIQ